MVNHYNVFPLKSSHKKPKPTSHQDLAVKLLAIIGCQSLTFSSSNQAPSHYRNQNKDDSNNEDIKDILV